MSLLSELGFEPGQTLHYEGTKYSVLGAKNEGKGRLPSVRLENYSTGEVRLVRSWKLRDPQLGEQQDEAETPPDPEPVSTPRLKILIIDIETQPNLAYVWNVWNTNVQPHQLINEKDTISFAAKWLGDTETKFFSIHHQSREVMVQAAWDLLNEADAVIHYNGKRFDVPHLNLEFLRAKLTPPSPFRQIDLLATVRREFKFTHNKLDHVSDKLGIGRKVEHEGFNLWVKCMEGDDDAWNRMREYNIHDVELTEQLYYEILPWITNHPSYAALEGDARCPNCGSLDYRLNGTQFTKTGRYQRYTCKPCGKHFRDTHRTSAAKITETSSW